MDVLSLFKEACIKYDVSFELKDTRFVIATYWNVDCEEHPLYVSLFESDNLDRTNQVCSCLNQLLETKESIYVNIQPSLSSQSQAIKQHLESKLNFNFFIDTEERDSNLNKTMTLNKYLLGFKEKNTRIPVYPLYTS